VNNIITKSLVIFGLVGVGQMLALVFVGVATNESSPETVISLAKIDAAFLAMFSLVSIGVGQYFPKFLADNSTYDKYLIFSRTFRLLLAMLSVLVGVVFVFFGDIEYGLVLVSAIFVALGIDYALYVRGKQIEGAIVAFLRQSGIYAAMLVVMLSGFVNQAHYHWIMILFIIVFSLVASAYSLRVEGKGIFFEPRLPGFGEISLILSVGGAYFIYSFTKTLLVPIADLFLDQTDVVGVYIVSKLYFLFFSIRRVVIQIIHDRLVSDVYTSRYGLLLLIFSVLYCFFIYLSYFYNFDAYAVFLNIKVDYPVLSSLMLVSLCALGLYSTRLTMLGLFKIYQRIMVFVSFIFVCLLPIFMMLYGLIGVVALIILAEILISLLSFYFVKRAERIL